MWYNYSNLCLENCNFVPKVGMFMPLKFDTHELADLMKNFYTLTGIRIVLFDENYNEIYAYPKECLPFCHLMRRDANFYKQCCESDKTSFEICR